jgi:serine/threonine protein kinase/tetratricopeptide (TPR) repeat protein
LNQDSSPGGGTAVAERLETVRTSLADRYAVDREIGRGGMAAVYLAHDRQHDRDVAIKVLSPNLAALIGPDRFLREIRIAARLQHPHILPLFDSGTSHGLLYYVMPYVPGLSLRDRLAREIQLPLPDTLKIAREVADALSFAHASGIVHRDVKPANILLAGFPPPGGSLGQWHALVADFGVAHAASAAGDEVLTESGIAVGTPEYMSPEQGTGEPAIDGRADVYALGCVVFEMLAGERPFKGRTAQATIARHRLDPVPSLRVVRPALPAHVEAAVERAMAKVPADRFPTAESFAEALEAVADTPTAHGPSPTPPLPGPRRRWPLAAIALALAILATVLVVRWLPEPGSRVSGAEPSWIIVADFLGPPGDRTLPTAVHELVVAELDQSRVIAPMPRQLIAQAMRDAGLPDTATLSDDRARELAVRSSVRTVLTGSILPVGLAGYAIVLRVSDVDNGQTLFTVAKPALDRNLIPVVQSTAYAVRRALGERRGAIAANKPLVQVATPSFPAYRKYVEAVALTERGDATGSNRVLQEALALDTGFAAAWATMATNYQTMHLLDSAGVAIAEALRRPARLSDAQRYRLQADAAYQIRYDIPEAIRAYDLLLRIAPRSISAHNNRAVLLYSLGRYDEALAGFVRTEELEPFGVEQAQIEIFNQTATLLALGREADAVTATRKLTGHWAEYAALLTATYDSRWAAADSLAAAFLRSPNAPSWIRTAAITFLAGARAAQGASAQAGRQLRVSAESAEPETRHWFSNAVLLLAGAGGSAPGAAPPALLADTSGGGLVAAGIWAAMNGDTLTADGKLAALRRKPAVQLRRLGLGPVLLRGYALAARRRWNEVIGELRGPAAAGELDGGDLSQVSSMAVRLLLGRAYDQTGRVAEAAGMYRLVLDPRRTPYSHLALRGLAAPYAVRRLSSLSGHMFKVGSAVLH